MRPLPARAPLVLCTALLGLAASGCGGHKAVSLGPALPGTTAAAATTTTGTAPSTPVSFDVWLARGEQLVAEPRTHAPTPRIATAAVESLLAGPTAAERAAGIASAVPAGTRLLGVSIDRGVATVDLTSEYQAGGGALSMRVRLGQVVYTLTQFPTVQTVRFELDGTPVNVFSSAGIVLDHPVARNDYAALALGSATPKGPALAGSWQRLPAAPVPLQLGLASAWTGRELILYGLTGVARDGNVLKASNAVEAYDPATRTWRRLPSPPGPRVDVVQRAVWTGGRLIVPSAFATQIFDSADGSWRRLARGHSGLIVWTGRELIAWGGGCCGDAFSDGAAFDPATSTWRKLPASPLAGSAAPVGAWTGHELVIVVGNDDPDGNPWPARLARAAAYDPATNRWHRIPPLPAPRNGAVAVWDGHEVLVLGGSAGGPRGKPAPLTRVGLAYDPATNRWRRLPPMESGRIGAAVVWTGTRVLLWGGSETANGGPPTIPPHGLSYDPRANRWSPLPQAPLLGRLDPAGTWTGRSFVVWGGSVPASGSGTTFFYDGAAFTPARP
jgi:N-acetylneuraminic acid mutarotase